MNGQNNYKVLIVDNNHLNRYFLKIILERENIDVYEADDPYEAISTLEEDSNFDAIITEVRLMGMNGFNFCSQIKRIPELKNIPVIFFSSLRSLEIKAKAFEVGAVDYIAKPASSTEILVRIKNHIKLYRTSKQLKEALEKINRELYLAQRLQETMLPHKTLSTSNIVMNWIYLPSKNISGDMLGIIPLANGYSLFYVFDVSGHGISSALFSVIVREEIERATEVQNEPIEIFKELDFRLKKHNMKEYYVTLTASFIDNEGNLKCINFGHWFPLIKRKENIELCESSNFPLGLGLIENVKELDVFSTKLEKGNFLIKYTDGLLEILEKEQEIKGFGRLKEIFKKALTGEDLKRQILKEIESKGKGYFEDDVTLLILEFM